MRVLKSTSVIRTAEFDETRACRYSLGRRWGDEQRRILCVMLNPSCADEILDDPTITRCVDYSERWGFRDLTVCNLFALRATDPEALWKGEEPIGDRNLDVIQREAERAERIVAAWGGAHRRQPRFIEQEKVTITAIQRHAVMWCLGRTQGEHPRHPLYLSPTLVPEEWRR